MASPTASPEGRASLTVSKVLLTSPVVPGERIQWKVTVTNDGPSRARDVVVRDTVPSGVKKPSMGGSSPCALASGEFTCGAVDIAVGESKSWTLSGTLDPAASKVPDNTVTVTGGPDPATPTHTVVATATGTPSPRTSLTVSKVLVTSPVLPGGRVEWRITVKNDGPSDASSVSVVEKVPDGVRDARMTGGTEECGSFGSGAFLCTENIAAGASVTWTLSGTLDPKAKEAPANAVTMIEGPIPRNTITGATASADPVPAQGIAISKKADHTSVGATGTVTYTVTVANIGGNDVAGVRVVDDLTGVLDDATYNGDAKASSGTTDYAEPRLTWTGDIARGKKATFTYSVTVPEKLPAGGDRNLVNTVSSDVPGGNCPAGSPEPECTVTVGVSDLSLRKSASPRLPKPGEKVTYTVEVRNGGTAPYRDYAFSDDLSGVLDDAEWNGDATASSGPAPAFDARGRKLTWTGDVPAGGTVTFTYSVTADRLPRGDAHLKNRVTSAEPGANCPQGAAKPGPECLTGGGLPRLRVEQHADGAAARRGERVAYVATITNTGKAPADNPVFLIGLDDITDDAVLLADLSADRGTARVVDKVERAGGRAATRAGAVRAAAPHTYEKLIRWEHGELAPGQTATVRYSVEVKHKDHKNLILASYMWTPFHPSNCPTDTHTRPECRVATRVSLLDFKKSVLSGTSPKPGERVTYTVEITNKGTVDFPDAGFTDDLSRVLDDATYNGDARASTGSVSYAAPTLSWRGTVPAGGRATVTYSFTVKKAPGDRTLRNGIAATGPGTNCPPGSTDPDCHVVGPTVTIPPEPSPTPSPTVLPPTGTGDNSTGLGIAAAVIALIGLGLVVAARARGRGPRTRGRRHV
ncbi:hypothetical protein ACFWZ2_27795 [Streptomyces sp. NPDC059002]|uniref:DUF7927 domain-containing protein n=1 Tax=Streptomyces sp. NPDC059002 TaxID=3346690 RepID=UPI0036C8C3F7